MMYYYLKVLSGDQAGESIRLQNGEHTIGRDSSCDILLSQPGISKKHAKITVADRIVTVEDLGSSNGTYVNGIFVTRKTVSVGDKIVLPGVVFSLNMGISEQQSQMQPTGSLGGSPIQVDIPRAEMPVHFNQGSFKSRVQDWFLKSVQPVIDRMLLQFDWKTVVFALLLIFGTLTTIVASVRFMAINHGTVRDEIKKRGLLMAERVAEINLPFIQNGDESSLQAEKFLNSPGVEAIYVATPEGKILAPMKNRDSYIPLNEGLSAARTEKGASIPVIVDGTITSIYVSYPIPKFDPIKKVNVVGAMAVVKMNLGAEELHWSESVTVILTTLVMSFIFVLLFYSIIYRMTAQPFQDMSDEVEQVLKGNRNELRVPVKFLELQTLVRSFNFLLNKIKTDRGSGKSSAPLMQRFDLNNDPSFKFVVEVAPGPVLVLNANQTVALVSSGMERDLMISQTNVGRSIVEACEDQTLLGNILEAEKEAKNLNGIPYSSNFDVFGREYSLKVVAAFDDLGEHVRTSFVFEEIRNG